MKLMLCLPFCLSALTSLTALVSFGTSQHVRGDVTDLIYSLQYRYCGIHLCSVDENYQPPICPPKSSQTNTDVDLETVGVGTLQGLVKQDNSSTVKQDNSSTANPLEGSNMSTTAVPIRYQVCPLCDGCSCKADCVIFGTCCVDKHIGSEYFFYCEQVLTYENGNTHSNEYWIVTKCPPDAPNYSLDLAMKCELEENNRPVTSSHRYGGNVTFRNQHCASCYDIASYTLWDVYLTCKSEFDVSNFPDMSSLIRSVKANPQCKIRYFANGTISPAKCSLRSMTISTCNVTGKWRQYNSIIEDACRLYVNPLYGWSYKNLFCYLCNGEDVEELECPSNCLRSLLKPVVVTPFAALLNFEKSDVQLVISVNYWQFPIKRIGNQTKSQCRPGDMFDPLSAKCREVYCPIIPEDDDSACLRLLYPGDLVRVVWYLTVTYLHEQVLLAGSFQKHAVGLAVATNVSTLVEGCGCTLVQGSAKDYARIRPPFDLVVVESQLELVVGLPGGGGLVPSRRCLQDLKQFSLNVTWDGRTIEVDVVSEDRPRNITDKLLVSNEGRGHGDRSVILVPLAFNISCPLVLFQEQEVEIENNSVVIHGFNELSVDEFFVTEENVYYICVDAVLEEPIVPMTKVVGNTTVYLIRQIVTGMCLSFSLLFLLLTLIVHLMVRDLHTIPGLNLVMLTASLFVAQALYLFGSGTVTTPTICTVLGVLIHYFWLVSFAWMNICCFHMYRVFTNLFSSLDFVGKTSSTLLKYAAFAYCIPLVIIITTLTTTYIRSDYTSIAYGGTSVCFVEGGLVSMVSFGVPAGLMVIINFGLLLYTTLLFHRNSTENPSAGKRDTSDISKFFKLSTITGMSWLFGFLGYFLGRKELVYVFTVLTASQGVFIFWAFVASRRVLHMAREVMGCQKKNGDRISSSGDSHNRKRVDSAPQFTSSTSSEIA